MRRTCSGKHSPKQVKKSTIRDHKIVLFGQVDRQVHILPKISGYLYRIWICSTCPDWKTFSFVKILTCLWTCRKKSVRNNRTCQDACFNFNSLSSSRAQIRIRKIILSYRLSVPEELLLSLLELLVSTTTRFLADPPAISTISIWPGTAPPVSGVFPSSSSMIGVPSPPSKIN